LKIDHPSFFHSLCSTHADVGFPPDSEPFSLSGSAGNAFVLLGEPGVFLNNDTPQNNKPVPSSIADIRKNSPYTSDTEPQPETK
jgi:hypothetical protein